ncbi:PQQ-like beta-propeller repeat protein [Tropicimonas isoalkanivorans]|uniref:Outer membrane protein assembly factor BamB, contains PQQ-like beta-propeller repeat n=1 Tax=Tropicimonas isoalkanivorans TaxID=441112 RepID=A0A1I1K8L2_9RHOB|nr:PQQ-like beta-propeller repeat protein [Tropicimonas isoalkanivorans]SFC57204.1 Outer membrane protein assembly factor BamB, contains PQQ-like beta-propeller repeat [Tropicimonas isoalkanivorans]
MKSLALTVGAVALALTLAGCSDEQRLPGERYDIRSPEGLALAGAGAVPRIDGAMPASAMSRNVPFSMPAQVNHTSWTHRGGSPAHRLQHPALGPTLTQVWSARIGAGETRKAKITADPVVADGRVFTLDAQSTVSGLSTGGGTLWSRNLTPPSDRTGDASGGGLAIGGGRMLVTTGFGELHALDPATGGTLWVQDFDAPVSGAPTIFGDLVYVSSRDNRAFAVRASDGRLQWELPAAPTASATVNGAGPAVTDRVAVFPFGSAELVATLRRGGIRLWTAILAGQRRGRAYAGVSDISSDPVIVGNTLYAGSPSGRIAAIDVNNGERIWTATEGAMSPVVVESGSVFAVTDIQQLVRIDAATGEVIWATDLPGFKNSRPRRHQAVFAHYGPVLAGGRLVVASDDGYIRSFSPQSGALLSQVPIPGGATTNPVVVNRTLYVVTTKGELLAFR